MNIKTLSGPMVGKKRQLNLGPQDGMTLIEITFAVLILAGSLVVLIGLQTSTLQRTARDQFSQQAMLRARRLIAPLESTTQPLENNVYEGRFLEVLKQVAPYDVAERDEDPNQPFDARVEIRDWALPEVGEKVMRLVEVSVAWGQANDEKVTLRYFLPADEGVVEDEEGENL